MRPAFVFVDRHLGHSKMSRQIVAEAFTYVVRRRFPRRRPARAAAAGRHV